MTKPRPLAVTDISPSICAKLDSLTRVAESGCWEWIGVKNPDGYGTLRDGQHQHLAHRLSYVRHKAGFTEDAPFVDHLCRVRSCINPEHLEAVSNRENALRGESPGVRLAREGTCARGHSTHDHGAIDSRGRAYCRICRSEYRRQYRQKVSERSFSPMQPLPPDIAARLEACAVGLWDGETDDLIVSIRAAGWPVYSIAHAADVSVSKIYRSLKRGVPSIEFRSPTKPAKQRKWRGHPFEESGRK